MQKPIAIIAGEPNSISSEIIFKCWKLRKKFKHKPFIIIGNIKLLSLQKKKLKYNIPFKEIDHNFKNKDLISNKLLIYNIKFSQKEFFFWTSIKKKNNIGKVKKFIIRKLYGGKLNDVIAPKNKGIK